MKTKIIALLVIVIPIFELAAADLLVEPGDTLKLKKTNFEYDPVVYDAVNHLNKAVRYTSQLHVADSILPFKSMFTPSSTVICEYCETKSIITLSTFIQDVKQHFPEGMNFDYDQRKTLIQKYHLKDSIFKVYIPFEKVVYGELDEGRILNREKESKNTLIAELILDYHLKTIQINRIHNSSQNPNFFLLGPTVQFRLNNEENSGDVIVNQSRSNSLGLELNYFLNPFNGFSAGNRMNLYIKTGLRFLVRSNRSEYQSNKDIGTYQSVNQDQSGFGLSAEFRMAEPSQDLQNFTLSIPLGVSKLIETSKLSSVKLDLQVNYNIDFNRTFDYRYSTEISSVTVTGSSEPLPEIYWQNAMIGAGLLNSQVAEERDLNNLNYLSYGGGVSYLHDLGRTVLALGVSVEILDYGLGDGLKKIGFPNIGLTETYSTSGRTQELINAASIEQPWQNTLLENNPVYFGIHASILF